MADALKSARDRRAMLPTPPFYDDLSASLTQSWALLARGVADRHSPFHAPAVASIGLDGSPQQRTMILRKVDSNARALLFNTDARSPKFAEFTKVPLVSILAYSEADKIQIRISGTVSLERTTQQAEQAWTRMRDQSRVGYGQIHPPGTTVPASELCPPPVALGIDDPAAAAARENFCLLCVQVNGIEWVYLSLRGNRRAHFTWPAGQLNARWLAP
jgi:hypothetical protein